MAGAVYYLTNSLFSLAKKASAATVRGRKCTSVSKVVTKSSSNKNGMYYVYLIGEGFIEIH